VRTTKETISGKYIISTPPSLPCPWDRIVIELPNKIDRRREAVDGRVSSLGCPGEVRSLYDVRLVWIVVSTGLTYDEQNKSRPGMIIFETRRPEP